MKRCDYSSKVKYLLQCDEIHLEVVTLLFFALVFQPYLKLYGFFPTFLFKFDLIFFCYFHILVKRNRPAVLSSIFPTKCTIVKIEITFYCLSTVFRIIVTSGKTASNSKRNL